MIAVCFLLLVAGATAQGQLPTVVVSVAGGRILYDEANINVTINVELSGRDENDNQTHSVQISTTEADILSATATAGLDYEPLEEELLFPPGTNSVDVTLRLKDDDTVEMIEYFFVNTTFTSGDMSTTETLIIIQDDGDRITIAFQEDSYTTDELSPVVVCVVVVSGSVELAVEFSVTFIPITAISGVDYSPVALSNSMSLEANMNELCLNIPILPDDAIEDTESFRIDLDGGISADVTTPATTTVYINDVNGGVVSIVNPAQLGQLSSSFMVTEGDQNTTLLFCIELVEGGAEPIGRSIVVLVNASMSNGTASTFVDFDPVSNLELTLPSGSSNGDRVCHNLTIVGDDIPEGTESFQITAYAVTSFDRVDNNGTVYIINDDEFLQCPDLPSPGPNGRVNVTISDPLNTVQIANYSCDPGYLLNTNESERVCLISGNWSGIDPLCEPVDCGGLSNPFLGQVVFDNTTFGSTAYYFCSEGFQVDGDSNRTCQSSGEWSGSDPTCVHANCSELEDPMNGSVLVIRFFNLPSVAIYGCDVGFTIEGDDIRRCQSNASWTGDEPTCEIVDCGDLEDPQNGQVSLNSTVYQSTANYSCNEGYVTASGSITRECLATGVWSGEALSCIGIDCGDPPVPQNGAAFVNSTIFGPGVVVYSCMEGYNLVGQVFQTCEVNGMWSDEVPSCNAIECEELDNPVSGNVSFARPPEFNTQASYSCNEGYRLVGNDTRQCLSNGQWSGSQPMCQVVDCGDLEGPENGQVLLTNSVFMSNATYTCNEGYLIEGSPTRVCQSDGQWSGSEPQCEIADCGPLASPVGGSVTLDGTVFGSEAVYSCSAGLTLTGGSSIRVCGSDGQWTGTEPICQQIAPSVPPSAGAVAPEDNSNTIIIVVCVCGGAFVIAVIVNTIIIVIAIRRARRRASYNLTRQQHVFENRASISRHTAHRDDLRETDNDLYSRADDDSPIEFVPVGSGNTVPAPTSQTVDTTNVDTSSNDESSSGRESTDIDVQSSASTEEN